MTIEHDSILDPERHEPKGLSSAPTDYVYVSDGGGADTGTWKLPRPEGSDTALIHQSPQSDGAGGLSWDYPSGVVYAQMDMISNANVQSVSYTSATARATWLSTDTSYIKMTGTNFPFVATILDHFTFDAAHDTLVVQIAGDYQLDFWGSFLLNDTNTFLSIKYAINDATPYSLQKLTGQSATASDVVNLSAAGIVEGLSVNDTISIYVAAWRASATATNITFEDGGITATLLHEA